MKRGTIFQAQAISGLTAQAVSSILRRGQWISGARTEGYPHQPQREGRNKEGLCLEPQRWTPLHPNTPGPSCPSGANHGCAHTTETCTRPHTPRDRLLDTLKEQRQGASACSCPREISPALGAHGLAHLQSPPGLPTRRFCKAECFQDHLRPHPTCLLCLWEWGNKVS